MTRTFFAAVVVALLLATSFHGADAQERKKSNERQRSEREQSAPKATGGWPSCHSGLVILEDGGTALCQHRDGRVCTMSDGGGQYVTLSNCK